MLVEQTKKLILEPNLKPGETGLFIQIEKDYHLKPILNKFDLMKLKGPTM